MRTRFVAIVQIAVDISEPFNMDDLPLLADDLLRDRARQFSEFLEDETQANYNYREAVKRMLDNEQVRLIVNLDDVRDYDRVYADG